MDEFLRYVVRQLVEYPEEALLDHREQGEKITYTLRVRESDAGRLIGKGGSTIRSIRDVLTAGGRRQGVKAALELQR
jgi:uncharacterized protein